MNKRLLAIILLQIVLLGSLVGKYYWITAAGQEITLKTAPVDPRDLFYGDYVILGYEISRIDKQQIPSQLEPGHRGTVYVLLEQRDHPWHEAVGVYAEKPAVEGNQVMMRGELDYQTGEEIRISYGIERYYIPENSGHLYEQQGEELRLVDVKVAKSGEAVIIRLRQG